MRKSGPTQDRPEPSLQIWCGRRDLNPHGPFKPCGFSCRPRLSPPRVSLFESFTPGLRSGLSLHPPPQPPELRCCPSSLYTFPAAVSPGLARDCHLQVSPTLSSSASPVSQASTQVFLKSAAYAIPPRPRGGFISALYHRARTWNLHSSFAARCPGGTSRGKPQFVFVVKGWASPIWT